MGTSGPPPSPLGIRGRSKLPPLDGLAVIADCQLGTDICPRERNDIPEYVATACAAATQRS